MYNCTKGVQLYPNVYNCSKVYNCTKGVHLFKRFITIQKVYDRIKMCTTVQKEYNSARNVQWFSKAVKSVKRLKYVYCIFLVKMLIYKQCKTWQKM